MFTIPIFCNYCGQLIKELEIKEDNAKLIKDISQNKLFWHDDCAVECGISLHRKDIERKRRYIEMCKLKYKRKCKRDQEKLPHNQTLIDSFCEKNLNKNGGNKIGK